MAEVISSAHAFGEPHTPPFEVMEVNTESSGPVFEQTFHEEAFIAFLNAMEKIDRRRGLNKQVDDEQYDMRAIAERIKFLIESSVSNQLVIMKMKYDKAENFTVSLVPQSGLDSKRRRELFEYINEIRSITIDTVHQIYDITTADNQNVSLKTCAHGR